METVNEKLKEMKEQAKSGEYCMAKHVYTWIKDVYTGQETSFGKPCETCRYSRLCYYMYLQNWQDLIFPILDREGVSIRMIVEENGRPSMQETEEDVEDRKCMEKGKFRPTGEYCMSRFFVSWYYAMSNGKQPTKGDACEHCPYRNYCEKHHVDFRDHIFPVIERQLGKEMA